MTIIVLTTMHVAILMGRVHLQNAKQTGLLLKNCHF